MVKRGKKSASEKAIDDIEEKLDDPDNFKADVSALLTKIYFDVLMGSLSDEANVNASLLARTFATWDVTTKVGAYVVADKNNPTTDEQAILAELRKLFHIDLVDDDDVTDAKMDYTAYSAIIVGSSSDVVKLGNLTDLTVPIVFTKGEHAATIGKMAAVLAGNYGSSTGTEWNVTDNSHPTMLTETVEEHHVIYSEDGDLTWLLSAALAAGVGSFVTVQDEATHVSLAILPIDGVNSDGELSPEIRYFLGLPDVSKYTSHTLEHVHWIADWIVHQLALVTVVQSLTKSKIIEEMLGKGNFVKTRNLYDYLVTGTTGAAPFEVITEQESRSVMERLEWIKNGIRRGTGTILPANKSLYDFLLAIPSQAFPFTNPGAALDVTNIRTSAYTLLTNGSYGLLALETLIDAVEGKLDVPANFMADVSALALEATLGTHDTDIKALLATIGGYIDTEIATIIAGIGTVDTNVDTLITRVPAEVTQRAKSTFVVREKFFADSVRITLNENGSSEAIKTNFTISLIPSGVTLDYVHVYVFAQVVENTNAAANKVVGAQNIQIQKNSGGSWTNCVSVLDGALQVPAETRDMGRLLGAPVDCKAEVDSNTAYDIQWTSSLVDKTSMYLDDVFFILEIGYH